METFDLKNINNRNVKTIQKLGGSNPVGDYIGVNSFYITYNNIPFYIVMGEFQFSRYPNAFWEEEIIKMKMCGVNTISTYIFWIQHESQEGIFDWGGNNDLRRFVELCRKHSIYVFLRIGPFVNGECRNGGFPDWIKYKCFEVRSNNQEYLHLVGQYYNEIGKQVSDLMFCNGGNIIGIQLDNEYESASPPWGDQYLAGEENVPVGDDGTSHVIHLKKLSLKAGLTAPIFSVTAWGSPVPEGEVLPMQGCYPYPSWMKPGAAVKLSDCYILEDEHESQSNKWYKTHYNISEVPFGCCEISGGAMSTYFHRVYCEPGAIKALTITKIANSCNILGYYIFHGVTIPFERNCFLNGYLWPKRSYDYQAPIREFGQLNTSYAPLKTIFMFLSSFGDGLAPMQTVPTNDNVVISKNTTDKVRCSVRTDGHSGYVFINNFQDHLEMRDINDVIFKIGTADEEIVIPRKGSMTVQKNASFILPFNLQMGNMCLKYATAQLITVISDENNLHYFFEKQAPNAAEYCFNISDVSTVAAKDFEVFDDTYSIKDDQSDHSVFEIQDKNGKTVFIHSLSAELSKKLWKVKLNGKDKIIFTDATVLQESDNSIRVISDKSHNFGLDIFPITQGDILCSSGSIYQSNVQDYSRIEVHIPKRELDISVDIIVLAPLTGAEFRMGREARCEFDEDIAPEVSDSCTMGMSCLFQVRETTNKSKFVAPEWAHRYNKSDFPYRINFDKPDAWTKDNYWWIEIGGMNDAIGDTETLRDELLKITYGVWDFIKNSGELNSDNWELDWVGILPGKRESRRYAGDYILTQNDVRAEGKFDDLVAYGGWSMDDHNPKGFDPSVKPTIWHPAPSPFGIPYRSMYSVNIKNLMFAGRNISCTHTAMSASRVMGTCGVIGQAVGTAAAIAVKNNLTPRDVYKEKITQLKQTLMEDDCYLPFNSRSKSDLMEQAVVTDEVLFNGMDRGENYWEGKFEDEVTVTLNQTSTVDWIEFIFDSDLQRNCWNGQRWYKKDFVMKCNTYLDDEPLQMPGTLLKSFSVFVDRGNGKWEKVSEETNNRNRVVRISLKEAVKQIKIVPHSAWNMSTARIYSIYFK